MISTLVVSGAVPEGIETVLADKILSLKFGPKKVLTGKDLNGFLHFNPQDSTVDVELAEVSSNGNGLQFNLNGTYSIHAVK